MRPYNFYYNQQIRTYIKQFLRVFSGLQVQTGVDRDNDTELDMIPVTVSYGDMDRVVANVLYKDNTFMASRLPIIAGYMTNLDLNPENKKSRHHIETITTQDAGDSTRGAFSRSMGVPYKMNFDLSLMSSNSDQMFQMLEQILLMFDPVLNFQKSDDIRDWSYITKAELVGISNENNYPASETERMIVWTLSFTLDIWLNYPSIDKSSVIEEIEANMKDDSIDILGIDIGQVLVP